MRYFLLLTLAFLLNFNFVFASVFIDSDNDGVIDQDEINIYKTNVNRSDTDNDGYSDWIELNNGYSPHIVGNIKLEDSDFDNDGLSDRMELNFRTDLSKSDTDNDGYSDGDEIKNGYNPLNQEKVKLEKRIEVNTNIQRLSYFLGGVRLGESIISSGVNNSTPKGLFYIDTKKEMAWSSFGLWMPYWMSFSNGYYGLHELPVWPSGKKEGESHLGTAVSHGCVRLGATDAEHLYNWADIGTMVNIY